MRRLLVPVPGNHGNKALSPAEWPAEEIERSQYCIRNDHWVPGKVERNEPYLPLRLESQRKVPRGYV